MSAKQDSYSETGSHRNRFPRDAATRVHHCLTLYFAPRLLRFAGSSANSATMSCSDNCCYSTKKCLGNCWCCCQDVVSAPEHCHCAVRSCRCRRLVGCPSRGRPLSLRAQPLFLYWSQIARCSRDRPWLLSYLWLRLHLFPL